MIPLAAGLLAVKAATTVLASASRAADGAARTASDMTAGITGTTPPATPNPGALIGGALEKALTGKEPRGR